MEIIFGRKPTLQPSDPGKYAKLWEALRQAAPEEWLAVKIKDLVGKTPSIAKGNLWQAAKKVGLRIQTVVEGDLIYLRLKRRDTPAPKPAPPLPAPAVPPPAPKAIPAPPAPAVKPAPAPAKPTSTMATGPKDPAVMAADLEKLLNDLIADDDGEWRSVDMGTGSSFYATFDRELKTMAKDRALKIDTDRDGQLLWAQIVSRSKTK